MVHLVQVATCNLNQWAMDFDLNLDNIKQSIRQDIMHTHTCAHHLLQRPGTRVTCRGNLLTHRYSCVHSGVVVVV
jgi:hypothetical protein